jgi:hypothetical protein
MGLAVASMCGVGAWLVLAKGNTIAPAVAAGSSTAAPTAAASPADADVAPLGQPGRELAPTQELASRSAGESADEDLYEELMTLFSLEDRKVYELLRQRFAIDVTGTARMCQLAVAEFFGVEVISFDEAFLGAAFAAWLDTTNSPTDVLAAVLAVVPDDYGYDRRGGPLFPIAQSLAKRSERLPPQPDGQQRALVHALVAAADHHGQRRGHGILVARALGLAIAHDPMTQAALTRLARSPVQRVREVAWDELAEELPPAALLAVIDEPLPWIHDERDDHDVKRISAVLASVRNAPDQRGLVHRWIGARLEDLARQSRGDADPQTDKARAQWLFLLGRNLKDEDVKALQPELQVLADGKGQLANCARRLLTPR